jgi:hypothetical protein
LRPVFNIRLLTTAILFTAAVLVFTHLPQEIIPSPLLKDGIGELEHFLAASIK